MADRSVENYLQTEQLYAAVTGLVDRALTERQYNIDDFRRALDRVLSQGKIIGYQEAGNWRERKPVPGEVWHLRAAPDDTALIASFGTAEGFDDVVKYSRDLCECCNRPVQSNRRLADFLRLYDPPTSAAIEAWQRIVDSGIS